MWTDHYLRAKTEAELARALPMLRMKVPAVESRRGQKREKAREVWTVSAHHAVDPIGPMLVKEATYRKGGDKVLKPAKIDKAFHANLRLHVDHPERAKILKAMARFVITPKTPRRVWA